MSEFDNINNRLENGDSSRNENSGEQAHAESDAYSQLMQAQNNFNINSQEPTVSEVPQSSQDVSYGTSEQAQGTENDSYRQPVITSKAERQEYSNEYVYSPDVQKPRSSKGGKVALAVVAALLSVFVIVMATVSVYTALLTTNKIVINTGDGVTRIDGEVTDFDTGFDNDTPAISEDTPDIEEDTNLRGTATVADDRTYPTLEQLAAPEDALSIPDIYDKASPSVVGVSCTLRSGTATGTGIIISTDGYIITNAHVIEDAQTVMIVDADSNQYEAEIIGYDSQTDLAVLKIEADGLTACEFGISSDIRIGELVVAIGNPLGFDLYGTLTTGVISGLNRTLTIGDYEMNLLQTNASINNGNSGGPLIDAYGRVIGITSAKVASIYGEGLGFAIPIDEAIPIIEDLIHYGYVTGRPQIGISGEDITSLMSMYYRLPQGVYVRFINPDSCAEKAGIKAGDIIIGADGETITCMDELNEIKSRFSAGDSMVITVYRDGVSMDIELTLDEATASE